MRTETKRIVCIVLGMCVFALAFGLFCKKFFLEVHAQGLATPTSVVATGSDTVATPSDVDTSLYLSYDRGPGIFNDIYEMLLSIRNVLVMFFGFWFLTWVFQRFKVIMQMLYRRGAK